MGIRTKFSSMGGRSSKKLVELPFVQPVLSSQIDVGGNSFAISGSRSPLSDSGYLLSDGDTSAGIRFRTTGTFDMYIYNPDPLKITQIKIWGNNSYVNLASYSLSIKRGDSISSSILVNYTSSYANNIITIILNDSDFSNYYMLTWNNQASWYMYEVEITATYMGYQ